MKNKIVKKITNKDGATLIIALLMMLIAALVCGIIISAALTSVKTAKNDFDNQQAYLTVSSAAEIVKSKIESTKCSSKRVEVYSTNPENGGALESSTYITTSSGSFRDWIEAAFAFIDKYGEVKSYQRNMIIEAEGLEQVTASFQMDSSYNIKVTFTLEDKKNRVSPFLVLEINSSGKDNSAEVTEAVRDEDNKYVISTKYPEISWEGGTITALQSDASK